MSVPKQEVELPLSQPPESKRAKAFPRIITQRIIPRRFSGWDPYEVWRTRVKAPREGADEDKLDSVG